jgi:hypothetical protein
MESDTSNPTDPTPPARKGFVRRMLSWRILLFVIAALITLLALFHAEENFRGAHAWNKYKAERRAAGEIVDATAIISPKVPDDENFAMTPFLAPLFDFYPGTQKHRDTNAVTRAQEYFKDIADGPNAATNAFATDLVTFANLIAHPKDKPDSNKPQVTDTQAAARVVLEALRPYSAVIEELRTASQRPYVRFNIAWDTPDKISILLPHLIAIKRAVRALSLQTAAELALGQTDLALNDVKLALYLSEAPKHEAIVVSELVRNACLQMTTQPLTVGLQNHQWTDEQLTQLQQALEKIDTIAGIANALNGESKILVNSAFERLKAESNRLKLLDTWSSMTDGSAHGVGANPIAECLFWAAVPRGWCDFEQLNYERYFNEHIMAAIDVAHHSIDPMLAANGETALQKIKGLGPVHNVLHHEVIAVVALPSLHRVAQKTALIQAEINMQLLTCALERYRLAHGRYPDDLNALIPEFAKSLPNDPIKGGPLHYHRDGSAFVLYSVGWNGTDDGGKVIAKNKSRNDPNQGDWVWGIPAKY